jgi:ethanolamine ammonia-lyase small subunit
MIDLRQIGDAPVVLEPDSGAPLARRFGLSAIETMRAQVTLKADGPVVRADGRLTAAIQQACAIPARISR